MPAPPQQPGWQAGGGSQSRAPFNWPMPSRLENFLLTGYLMFMPIYEFHCEKCGRNSEILVRSANWNGTKCPHCGSSKLEKKFSTFAAAGPGVVATPEKKYGHRCGGGGCGCH
jgi:putative FmdB family regulatory protein